MIHKLLISSVLALLSASPAVAQGDEAVWPEVTTAAKAGSRWWWMGSAVDKDELKRLMAQYAEAGIGTLEITPIYGVQGNGANNIAFLSDRWFDMLRFVCDEGRRLGLAIDMSTGTGWPFGGPSVKAEESASKLITAEQTVTGDGQTPLSLSADVDGTLQRLLAFPAKGTDGTPHDLTPLISEGKALWTAPAGQWRVIAVGYKPRVMQVKRPSAGGEGYVLDHFDSTAVANYLKHIAGRFEAAGAPWPHAFFCDSYEITQADWTRDLFSQFAHYRGYRLEDVFDKLMDQDAAVVSDYRQTLSDLLRDHFVRQWTAWAHSHGVLTRYQAHGSPGNLADLYAEADVPETETFYQADWRIRGLRQDPGYTMASLSSLPTLKYASSAAHVAGKTLVSSESMTWLTEHFRTSLSQMKPELDRLFVAGVNHIMFHGTAYSPSTAAWPGWKFYAAVDLSPTNSIWRDAPAMMDYISRVQSFLQQGTPDNEVLVYAPFAAAMRKTSGTFQNRLLLFDINTLDSKMADVAKSVNTLMAAGYDCDYISDLQLLATTFDGHVLRTAAGTAYKVIVVPTATNMPADVKSHLEQLAAQGAAVVWQTDADALAAAGAKAEPLRQQGLSLIRRAVGGNHVYFIANLTADDYRDYATLATDYASANLYNPQTGAIAPAVTDPQGRILLDLKSGQSVIVHTFPFPPAVASAATTAIGSIAVDGPWLLSFTADTWPDMDSAIPAYELEKTQTWETIDSKTAILMGTGVYQTTFTLTREQVAAATGGFTLLLGDVRESARVWLNDGYLGCAWSAPFELDCLNTVKEGVNTLRIEVTNLPANRISHMDREGTPWRIFDDINMANISQADYGQWALVPSGLNSPLTLVAKATGGTGLTAALESMAPQADGSYVPVYRLSADDGQPLVSATATLADGTPFTALTASAAPDGSLSLTVTGQAQGDAIVTATTAGGQQHRAFVMAKGGYRLVRSIDFTADSAPGGGWTAFDKPGAITGFAAEGKVAWRRSTANGREVTQLYDGLTFGSDAVNYYFYFPGYGMYANNDFTVTLPASDGTVAQLTYVVGSGDASQTYQAADSLSVFTVCRAPQSSLTLDLPGNKQYYIYRTLSVFEPLGSGQGVATPRVAVAAPADAVFDLQGRRIAPRRPLRRGLYVSRGRKLVVR